MNHNFHHQHSHVAGGIPDLVHVIFQSGHQLTGIGPVKIFCGKPLHMHKQGFPDGVSNFGRCCIKNKFFQVAKHGPSGSNGKNHQQQFWQKLCLPFSQYIINQSGCHLRRQHVQSHLENHTDQCCCIHVPVFPYVCGYFYHLLSPSPCLVS